MRRLAGGEFIMGSDRFYPEERPARRVRVAPFWIDEVPVTNREFAAFVKASGYRTFAEMAPDTTNYPNVDVQMSRAGSLVFERPAAPVSLGDPSLWWKFRAGA